MKNAFLPGGALIPHGVDLAKWGVVACDQYTSEPAYWARVEQYVGDSPSTLHMILPEAYLSDTAAASRFEASIGAVMQSALDSGYLRPAGNGYILVERTQRDGAVRLGLVGRLDLEAYDYAPGSAPPVRATEGTVVERIPPRCAARRVAAVELPHIMLLIDDPGLTVIEPSFSIADTFERLYDTALMENSGHLRGYLLNDAETRRVEQCLEGFFSREMALAVGDGNHSLGAAKMHWEQLKPTLTADELDTHPARYALCELVNLHSRALNFEPIHRVVTGVDPLKFSKLFTPSSGGNEIEIVTAEGRVRMETGLDSAARAVAYVQEIIDEYIAINGGSVDYVHGGDVACELGAQPSSAAVLLPSMPKTELFSSVLADGALPRKTFSMGESHDKRFYFEARRII